MPMGRGGDTRELEGPLIVLASSESSYMTGHIHRPRRLVSGRRGVTVTLADPSLISVN